MTSATTSTRRRYTLSLRALMIVVLVIGGGLGWIVKRANSRRGAVEAVRKAKGQVYFDYQKSGESYDPTARPRLPGWLIRLVGEEFFYDVTLVNAVDFSQSDPPVARAAMEAIGGFARLERLRIGNPPEGSTISGLDHLKRLEISIVGPVSAHAIRLGSLASVREVFLDGPGVNDSIVPDLAALGSVREIRLENTSITDDGLARFRGPAELEVLWLNGAQITDAGLVHLAGLRKLDILSVSGNRGITDEGVRFLSKSLPGLTHLMVSDTSVTDAGLVHVAEFRRLMGFQVSGQGARITDLGLARLASLVQLEVLNVRGSGVTDAGLAHLIPLNKLRWLDAADTAITDEGVLHLEKVQSLRWLDLSRTRITDAGLEPISRITALQSLSVEGMPLTDAGLKHLHALKSLLRLLIRNTSVTPRGIAALRAVLRPAVVIRAGRAPVPTPVSVPPPLKPGVGPGGK